MPRHHLNLTGASTIKTPHHALTARLVPNIIEHAAIGAIYGEAGNGKTFSVESALERVTTPSVEIASLRRPTMKYLALSVLEGITKVSHQGELMRLTEDLRAVLAEKRRLIVIDEAQNLSTECFEYMRHLHDDPRTDFALLFVGGNRCWEVIARHPMLRSRIWHKVEFKPLSLAEVRKIMPRYHAIYREADPELLLEIDEEFAHGNFRHWAAFTKTAALICQEHKQKIVDRKIVDIVLTLHQGGASAEAA
jgi:DNA transposition AAA+ family ATPase